MIRYYFQRVKYFLKEKFESITEFFGFWWIMGTIYLRSLVIKLTYKFNKNIPVIWVKISCKHGVFLFRSIKLYDEERKYDYCYTINDERMVLDNKGKAFPLTDFMFKCSVTGYWKDINGISKYILEV
jgi:hypothetical protein